MTAGEQRVRRLFDEHYDAVYAYCLRRLPEADARDAVAEVFAVAWRRSADIPEESERSWLYGVAHRRLQHHWRATARRRRLRNRLQSVPAEPSRSPEPQVVRRAEYDLVTRAAAALRPLDREVLRLALWEQLSHAEIATVVGASPQAVKQRVYRARQQLAREFTKLGGTVPGTSEGGSA